MNIMKFWLVAAAFASAAGAGTHPNDLGMASMARAYGGAVREAQGLQPCGFQPFWFMNGETVSATEGNRNLPRELWTTKAEAEEITRRFAAEREALGYRTRLPKIWGYRHSFRMWPKSEVWEKHREFFGLTPYGTRGVVMAGWPSWMKTLSKVCVANEGVVDRRVEEWVKAGCPEYAFISENVRVRYAPGAEERPAVVQDDCTDVTFRDCSFRKPKKVEAAPGK